MNIRTESCCFYAGCLLHRRGVLGFRNARVWCFLARHQGGPPYSLLPSLVNEGSYKMSPVQHARGAWGYATSELSPWTPDLREDLAPVLPPTRPSSSFGVLKSAFHII